MMHYECDQCKARLDPGERCDCIAGKEKVPHGVTAPSETKIIKPKDSIAGNASVVKPGAGMRCATCFWGMTDALPGRLCVQWESPHADTWVSDDDTCDFWEG